MERVVEDEVGRDGCVMVMSASILVEKSPDVTTRSILPDGGFCDGGVKRWRGSSC